MQAMMLAAVLMVGDGPHPGIRDVPFLHLYHSWAHYPYPSGSCARCRDCDGHRYDYRVEFDYPWQMKPLGPGCACGVPAAEISARSSRVSRQRALAALARERKSAGRSPRQPQTSLADRTDDGPSLR